MVFHAAVLIHLTVSIHIPKWFVEWGTHWAHLYTSNPQFSCALKTLLWKQFSWGKIKPMLFFLSFSPVLLGWVGLGNPWAGGSSRKEQSAQLLMALFGELTVLCHSSQSTNALPKRGSYSWKHLPWSHRDWPGALRCIINFVADSVSCDQSQRQIRTWQHCLDKQNSTSPSFVDASPGKHSFSDSAGEFCYSI